MDFESGEIKSLSNPAEVQQLYHDLIQSASHEISLLVCTPNALLRQHKIGLTQMVKDAANGKNVRINLIFPRHETENKTFLEIERLPTQSQNIAVRKYLSAGNQDSKIKSTILLVDKKFLLTINLKDDSKANFKEAIGIATYSENRTRNQSYGFVFDTIWRQAELFRELELRSLELEKLNETLKEFINVAAHELRTPTQAIVGFSEILEISNTSKRNRMYERAIARNARRLYSLIEDMLDVARIESKSFKLNKSKFDLNQEIERIVEDIIARDSWKENTHNVSLVFEPTTPIVVYADRERIYRVIQNLVNNSVKFTEYGTITISVEKSESDDVSVTVRDTGTGVDKDILPRLFFKFVTKSRQGTGLGLFISKGIIEAHGGKIEAYNNVDGPGATFCFTLPLVKTDV